jgi:hypothetical protein
VISDFAFSVKEDSTLDLCFRRRSARTHAMREDIQRLYPDRLDHRFAAAFWAISARRSAGMFSARFFPPLRPSSAAALESSRSCSISQVAIRATMTAPPTASAGRFSPLGPLGTDGVPMPGDALIQNAEVALQGAHLSRVDAVAARENADFDAQIVARIAQVNQGSVSLNGTRR